MNYQTFEPKEDLHSFIKCFWTLEDDGQLLEKQRIVPDGCMEMIFHYGDLYRQYLSTGKFIIQPRCFVFGQITRPLDIEPTGKTGIFAVRFSYDGFTPFASVPVNEIENRAVPLIELFGEEVKALEEKVLKSESTQERIELCEAFLLDRLALPESVDRIIKVSVDVMLNLKGQVSVTELSRELNIHRRQLERRFSSVVGLSPKQLSRIIRLQSTLKLLLTGQFTSLTALAYEGTYYDQAHFIKEFREFTGLSPKQFYADNLKLSSLFYTAE